MCCGIVQKFFLNNAIFFIFYECVFDRDISLVFTKVNCDISTGFQDENEKCRIMSKNSDANGKINFNKVDYGFIFQKTMVQET